MPLTRGLSLSIACAIVTSLAGGRAQADEPTRERCAASYVEGQHLLRDRHLLRAREALLVCARDPCPRALQPECVRWLSEVERVLPSVVIDVRDPQDRPVLDARIDLDGAELQKGLSGTARSLDPGKHLFHVTAQGERPIDAEVVVRESETSRLLVFRFVAPTQQSAPSPNGAAGTQSTTPSDAGPSASASGVSDDARPPRWPAYALGGLALGGAVSFASFSIAGLSLRSELDACKPNCSQARVDAGNRDWVAADVSLGVAALALAGAAYFFLRSEPSPPSPPPGRARAALIRPRDIFSVESP